MKLESAPLKEELAFAFHGARIGIGADSSDVLARLAERLPKGWQPLAARPIPTYSLRVTEGSRHVLWRGSRRVATAANVEGILDALESLLHLEIAKRAQGRLFVHAGVVGWGNQVVLLPGRTWSGKSTLVEALVRAGAVYFSDEYAVIDTNGFVHPYARPLSLRDSGAAPRRKLSADQLPRAPASEAWPLGLVAVTCYRPNGCWHPRLLTQGETLLALFANTILARLRPRFALDVLATAVRAVPSLRTERGEAEETALLLLKFLAQARSPPS